MHLKPLLNLCRELFLDVTFHRAFDLTRDPISSLQKLISLGIRRVLTSGQQQTAAKGIPLIRSLVETSRGQISIMPGGGVSEINIAEIFRGTGAREFHGSARVIKTSRMEYVNPHCSLTAPGVMRDDEMMVTSEERVKEIIRAAQLAEQETVRN